MSVVYPGGDYPITENLRVALYGMNETEAENFLVIDNLFPGGPLPPTSVNNPVAVAAGVSGATQTVRVPYMLTAEDIVRGYAFVNIPYPCEWPDLNETTTFTVCNPDETDGTDFSPGATFNRTTTGFTAILNLNAAVPIVQGQVDFVDLTAGQGYEFTPLAEGVYALTIVGTAIAPQGPLSNAQVNIDVSYTDNAGAEYDDAIVSIQDTLEASSILYPLYALPTAPITVFSSYVTFGVAGALPANVWNMTVTLGGTGTAAYGATLHQATSGATAFYYGSGISLGGQPGFMIYTVLSGTDGSDSGYVWTDPVSGQTFTPTSATSAGTFYGPGTNATQFVTGASGPEMNIPTTEMYLGPHISGVGDVPSGYIDVPGTPPSATHNYAWYDPVSGGVFIPTAAWTGTGPRVVFPYNLHIRIVQMPNNQTIYTPGQVTYLNVISIHD
jgi:hypothetical protein